MSNYTKERNIITINIDGVNGSYKFDINTATFYGLKGNPVKTCTHKRAIAELFYPYRHNGTRTNLSHTLYAMFDYSNRTEFYSRYAEAISVADKMDSLGLECMSWNVSQLEAIADDFKMFADWVKSLTDEQKQNRIYYSDFDAHRKLLKAKEKWGKAVMESFPDEIFSRLLDYDIMDYTAEEMSVCAYYLVRGKLFEYHQRDCRKLIEYINVCRAMNKQPQKQNNFMREYCETLKEYELRKIEFDNERIRQSYEKQAEALHFEYGDFEVVFPTCGKDLVDEGANMHHCVGGYVDCIINGNEYIVFVRKKDSPDKCYITCEVMLDGRIRQYYLAYDRNITSTEDIAFRNAYQEHLRTHWKK